MWPRFARAIFAINETGRSNVIGAADLDFGVGRNDTESNFVPLCHDRGRRDENTDCRIEKKKAVEEIDRGGPCAYGAASVFFDDSRLKMKVSASSASLATKSRSSRPKLLAS